MAIEHKVTDYITQSGNQRLGRMTCSCGLEVESDNLRKKSLRALRVELERLHEPTNSLGAMPKRKPKKNKPKEMTAGDKDEVEKEMEGWKEPDADEIEHESNEGD